MKNLPLKTFQLKNFKAVKDSEKIKFTPLTVFIGNNGSGKSSILEGLETFKNIIRNDIDFSLKDWKGMEHIWNKSNDHSMANNGFRKNPISFNISGTEPNKNKFSLEMTINSTINFDDYFIQSEVLKISKTTDKIKMERSSDRYDYQKPIFPKIIINDKTEKSIFQVYSNQSLVKYKADEKIEDSISSWQFLSLNPNIMGEPIKQRRTFGSIELAKDGSNIAEYLLDIKKLNQNAFEGIIEALQYVLPYALDVQSQITSELERAVFLQLTEEDFKVPGWLLSTGTLRVLGILALLRHPNPPPLILIEEIENGLDPRTIILILEEIRMAIDSGIQVIITTHSPYLLDLIPLNFIIFVERYKGETIFSRPSDQESLVKWSKDFSPGKLYTMGRFVKRK